MAVIWSNRVRIVSSSMFGLPATAGYNPAHLNSTVVLDIQVMDNGEVHAHVEEAAIKSPRGNIVGASYPCVIAIKHVPFQLSGSNLDGSTALATFTYYVPSPTGYFDAWVGPSGWYHFCNLSDIQMSGDGGYVYMSGSGTYSFVNAVYPACVPIFIPNIRRATAYYPWSIKKNGVYIPIDDKGTLKIRHNSALVDLKNNQVETSPQTLFAMHNSAWKRFPKPVSALSTGSFGVDATVLQLGYGVASSYSFSGTVNITRTSSANCGTFTISPSARISTSVTTMTQPSASGLSKAFTVTANPGLPVGDYQESIQITASNSPTVETVGVNFYIRYIGYDYTLPPIAVVTGDTVVLTADPGNVDPNNVTPCFAISSVGSTSIDLSTSNINGAFTGLTAGTYHGCVYAPESNTTMIGNQSPHVIFTIV